MVDDIRPSLPRPKQEMPEEATPREEPTFVPPEEIIDLSKEQEMQPDRVPKPRKIRFKRIKALFSRFKKWWQKRSRIQKLIIMGIAAVLLAGGAAAAAYAITKPNPPHIPEPQKVEAPPKPTTEASKLTGVQVDPEKNKLPVIGVMIENSPDARPQSGLYNAGVVFEAIAEGGITRFLTLYQEDQPGYVGPVRSARPYYLRWLLPFDAPYAHVGGSPNALNDIRSLGVKDLDQFHNPGAYDRVNSRYAPHNVYTGIGRLADLAASKGWKHSDFTGFARKKEEPAKTPNASSINIAISSALYNSSYAYDQKTNSYKRNMAGARHIDEKANKQIQPKNVVVIVTAQGFEPDGLHTTYKTTGSGQAFIFQDGSVTVGTWSKSGDKNQLLLGDKNGSPIGLNPGQTWVTIVGSASMVTYK